jgi:N-acetylmuramoyl-L-alanine amidase
MRKPEFTKLVNLNSDMIPEGRENRPQEKITPKFITVHNTDNTSRGADAAAHARFLKTRGFYFFPKDSDNKVWVSWHYTVDDKQVIRHLPPTEKAYHAQNGNDESIGIEICINAGINQAAANLRAARLIALLMLDFNIKLSQVVTHKHWTGKNCPSQLLDGGNEGSKWNAFKQMVAVQFRHIRK